MMIDQATLTAYLIILIGFVFIPGPAVLLTLARASSSGTGVGIATGLGIAAGDIIHTVMAVVGISAVVMASAFLFNLIKCLGAAYLIYLGLRAIFEKVAKPYPLASITLTPMVAFKQAILAEVLNPKSALFFLAFLPQFVNAENGSIPLQLFVLGILFVFAGLLSTTLVAVAAGRVGVFLRRNPSVVRWQNTFVGSVYCWLGFRLAVEER